MGKKNCILQIQFCYVKLKSLESDIENWKVDALRDADKAEVYALKDRIRGLRHELDGISTLQLSKLTKKEVKTFEDRCQDLLRQWKELRSIISTVSDNAYTKCFRILKMKPTTDWEEIKKAYKKRAQAVHPDKGGSDKEFMELKEAYEKLKAAYEK